METHRLTRPLFLGLHSESELSSSNLFTLVVRDTILAGVINLANALSRDLQVDRVGGSVQTIVTVLLHGVRVRARRGRVDDNQVLFSSVGEGNTSSLDACSSRPSLFN